MGLAQNIERVQERIGQACARSRRDPSSVTLVAVSKTFPAELVAEAYRLGLRDFGENRLEEAAEKIPNFKQGAGRRAQDAGRWHLVGHLQSRKAREAVALFDVIHSVDSTRLADKLSRLCIEAGRVMPILLECNVSGEQTKYGFSLAQPGKWGQWFAEVEAILALPGVRVEGLMTVAPQVSDPEEVRPVFRALRALRDEFVARFPQVGCHHLSMGMTDDLDIAVEEGATIVRVGRAIFGERHFPSLP